MKHSVTHTIGKQNIITSRYLYGNREPFCMKIIPVFIVFLLVLTGLPVANEGGFVGSTTAEEGDTQTGDLSPWLSYKEVIPLKRTTLVWEDTESLWDDYAYMAAVPTTVFEHKGNLFSSPLLFYAPPYEASGNADLTMNPYQGLDYFMQDWITAAEPDQLDLINVPREDISWDLGNGTDYSGDDIYALSAELALDNWEYAEEAVVAVVDEYPERMESSSGNVSGIIPGLPLKEEEFFGTKEVGIEPIYHNFTIDEGYSYINAHMEWGLVWTAGSEERGKDLDLQVYDWQLGQVSASENWNVVGTPGVRPFEDAFSCIYNTGDWGVAVTYMPTEALEDEEEGNQLTNEPEEREQEEQLADEPEESTESADAPLATWNSDADYEIYITEYPGTTVTIPEETFFMTRNANFELTWSGGGELTLLIREPAGAEMTRVTGTSPLTMTIDQLGEGTHTATVARMGTGSNEIDFELTYSWEAFKDRKEGESLASASNGAVWASMKNAPLLYVKEDSIPGEVKDALNTLGVREIDLVDFGNRFEGDMNDIRSKLQRSLGSVTHYKDEQSFYHRISDRSGQNDIVMTTMDPWTYWYSEEGPKGELDGSRFVGPATYSAAHHGAPVIIMELAPETSNPQAWHNRFWLEAYSNRKPPSVGCMVLTGHEFYDFLGEIGLDKEPVTQGEKGVEVKETILTVAGQFDIGTAWDRVLVGKANAGRILGTPVDTSTGVCRSVFYPLMIFANPAVTPELDPTNGMRITGSSSTVVGVPHAYTLKVDEGGETEVENPNLYTWVSQRHRFNERAGRDGYWGCDYTAASGITPYRTPSNNPIDKGNSPYRSDPDAMFWPDMTISEVVPFYGEKAGYDSVYSTGWTPVAENLNRGVIMWIEGAHGSNSGGGRIGFWDESNHEDSNPWRAYEDGGCTEEMELIDTLTGNRFSFGPDTVASDKNTGADYQIGQADGLVTAILQQHHTASVNGYTFDQDIDNLHGVGISGSSCLISNSYLHIAMIRHGSAFQVIDPWLTSWYSNFAIETFMRDIALGLTVGEAYANGIHHVGIEYLTGQWWWDIFENVVYFGDPDLRVYSPTYSWEEPESVSVFGLDANGHTPGGAEEHPNEVSMNYGFLVAVGAGILIAAVAIVWGSRKGADDEDEGGMDSEYFGEEPDEPEMIGEDEVDWEYEK